MTSITVNEQINVCGGKTYSHTVTCDHCGKSFTGKASGTWLLAPIWKYNARNKAYSSLYAHISDKHL